MIFLCMIFIFYIFFGILYGFHEDPLFSVNLHIYLHLTTRKSSKRLKFQSLDKALAIIEKASVPQRRPRYFNIQSAKGWKDA